MTARALTRLTVEPGPDGVLALAAELPDALAGSGPALAPVPAGPDGYVSRVLAAVRPDDPTAPLEDDDVAVVITTSGSMGEPRGVLLPASSLLSSARAADERLGGPARWVMALPAHHVAGLQVLVRAHLSGIPPIPLGSVGGAARFSAAEFANVTRAARAMSDVDGSQLRTALVPTQLARLTELGNRGGETLAAYDSILIGGAAAPAALVARARELGAQIVLTYGMTETSGGCVYDGSALDCSTVSLEDPSPDGVGRIVLGGATVARGYRLAPDLSAEAFRPGIHRTSDVGRINESGLLEVAGRIDDVVQVGGVNVSVAAIEAAVQAHPEVSEAAVVATADAQWGSRITAFVVADPAWNVADAALAQSVVSIAADALGSESRPRSVVVLDVLPTLLTGKVDRAALRARAAAEETS